MSQPGHVSMTIGSAEAPKQGRRSELREAGGMIAEDVVLSLSLSRSLALKR